MRDSGLPADVLVGKLKKDISFALRRGTIAQVTTHHHALDGYAWLRLPSARSSAEDEEELLALNRRAGGLGSLVGSSSALSLRDWSATLSCLQLL